MYSFYGGKRGQGFVIKKKYNSVQAMVEDFASPNCQVDIGEYVMISVDVNGKTAVDIPDTGKLYMREITGPEYITDLSGPRGKTPVIDIGTVSAPPGQAGSADTVKVTTTNHYDGDTKDYLGSSLNFTIPVPTMTLTGETGPVGSEVKIERVIKSNQTINDTKFTPEYHITIPRGWQGVGLVSAAIKRALNNTEDSHLILDYVDPSYPRGEGSVKPYSQDLGLIKTIVKVEIDGNSNLNCYYSNNPSTPVKLGTIRYITEFSKEPDFVFSNDPNNWVDASGTNAAKVYSKYSDTGNEKHYLGTLNSIDKIGKIIIPKTGDMKQCAQELLIGFTNGQLKNLGDIRGAKGDPGPPIQVHTYYTSLDELRANANKDDVVGLQPPGADDVSLWFYDVERNEWISLGKITTQDGIRVLVQEDEPLPGEQEIGDLWFMLNQ